MRLRKLNTFTHPPLRYKYYAAHALIKAGARLTGETDNNAELAMGENIQGHIHTLRGVQVMLDMNIAQLYGVEMKRLNKQVRRNRERFPEEFCIQLTENELHDLKSQTVALSDGKILKSQYATTILEELHER